MRLSFSILVWFFTFVALAQPTFFHDGALDTIANNQGYMDADIVTNLGNLPDAIGKTNLLMALTIKNIIATNTQDNPYLATSNNIYNYGGATNRSGLSNLLTSAFSSMFSNFVPPGGSAAVGSGSLAILTNDTVDAQFTSNSSIAVPFLNTYIPMNLTYEATGLPSSLPILVRGLIMLIVWFTFFRWMTEDAKEYFNETMNQRQVQGSTQEVAGTSASSVVGLGYAALFTAALAVAIGVVISGAVFSGFQGLSSTAKILSNVTAFAANSATSSQWNLITQFFPVYQILVAYVYYLWYANFLIVPIFYGVRAFIFWFVN